MKSTEIPTRYAPGWLESLDSRTAVAKDMRSRYLAMTDDLGGNDSLSYMQRSLCERALWLEYWLASQEKELAEGRAFDVAKWTQAVNSLQGVYAKLGLERKAKTVPHLHEYLARREAE